MKEQEMIKLARSVDLPDWASHVAVPKVRKENQAEPCIWSDEAEGYLDEDPKTLKNGDWAGGYNNQYWSFFSREQLTKPN